MSPSAEPTFCDYCGLPIPPPFWSRKESAVSEVPSEAFCCFGCRFAWSVTRSRGEAGRLNGTLTRIGLAIFFSMNVMVFSMALWTQEWSPTGNITPLASSLFDLFRYICLLFALPVFLLLGGPLLANAWETLRAGRFTVDALIVLGVGAAYLFSAVSVVRGSGPVYFEVGCMVLVLVTLGRWLDSVGKHKATQAIESLEKLLPDSVRLLRDGGEVIRPRAELQAGDLIRILPGERIACDGVLRRAATSVDEQILTGESVPLAKEVGDSVWSGTLNLEGEITVEVTEAEGDGALGRLISLVRESRSLKGHYERLADRAVQGFLPAVTLVALATVVFHANRSGAEQGLLAGLSVLLIACPCALGIATPLAVWTAMGTAARRGVLFRNGSALERLATIRAVRLDKTGPLTDGVPAVTSLSVDEGTDPQRVSAYANRLASASGHPLSSAVRAFTEQRRDFLAVGNPETLEEVTSLPGLGMTAKQSGQSSPIALGSVRLMEKSQFVFSNRLQRVVVRAVEQAQPLACIGWGGRVRGVFVFEECLRPDVKEAVSEIQARGLDVALLTGDHKARGDAVGRELNLSVHAELLPEDKVALLERARREHGTVSMVGDGINDAPALAASDVGVALGCGADVSRDAADVCLLGNDIRLLPALFDLARRTRRVIRQNLFWAFAYNGIGIGLAATGRLNPILAALAMVLSSAMVVANSLRLAEGDVLDEVATREIDQESDVGGSEPATDVMARPLTAGSPS